MNSKGRASLFTRSNQFEIISSILESHSVSYFRLLFFRPPRSSRFEGKGRKRKSPSIGSSARPKDAEKAGKAGKLSSCKKNTSLRGVRSLVIACQRYAKRYESICTGSLEETRSAEITGEAGKGTEGREEKDCLE